MGDVLLLVDHDHKNLELLSSYLRREGFPLLLTTSGSEALVLAVREQPALVVLDLVLPDLSGVEVIRKLRQNPVTANVPVLVLTALRSELDKVQGFEAGADDYVLKPFSIRELVLRLRALLRRAAPLAR